MENFVQRSSTFLTLFGDLFSCTCEMKEDPKRRLVSSLHRCVCEIFVAMKRGGGGRKDDGAPPRQLVDPIRDVDNEFYDSYDSDMNPA